MSGRINPFANLTESPVFAPKPKKDKPVEEDVIERIAQENKFPSRQASKPSNTIRRKPRIHRTGRNQQFNAKATAETIQRFYTAADEKRVALGELLKQGLDAIEVLDGLQKLANKRSIPLDKFIEQVLHGFDRAGASGQEQRKAVQSKGTEPEGMSV